MYKVPEDFARRVAEFAGEAGAAWIQALPALIDEYARRWHLTVAPPFEPLSYNYAAPALRADGSHAVLKLGIPRGALMTEIAALQLYDGDGICRLLEVDAERAVMLLEGLRPGTQLVSLQDDEQRTSIAASVMRRLWRPAPAGHSFPALADWFAGLAELRLEFEGGTGPFDTRLVEAAESAAAGLLASTEQPMLLHGDLHHYNILAAEREPWLAIDPKGIVGDPAYETGAFLYNVLPDNREPRALRRLIARRVDQLAEEIPLDRQRVLGWGIAQAVLSGWWSYEGHGYGWEEVMEVAAVLSTIRG